MASATITLKNLADANVVYSLVGSTATGALYKDVSRSLALPRTLEFQYNVGNPGAKGNDHLRIILKDTVQNSSTGIISVGSLSIDVSVPRDSAWTQTFTEDLMAALVPLFVDANCATIADAIVP